MELKPHHNTWLYTAKELEEEIPPVVDGVHTIDQELLQRAKGVDYIWKVGTQLELSLLTQYSACVFMHRFYTRKSSKKYHYCEVGAACLYLACKNVEDNSRLIREVIIHCARTASGNPKMALDEQSKVYWRWSDVITYTEELVLQAMCFDLEVESPYHYFDYLVKKFHMNESSEKFFQVGMAFINDSSRTPLHLEFTFKYIGQAAFLFCLDFLKIKLPVDKKTQKPWYEMLSQDINEVQNAFKEMARLTKVLAPHPSMAMLSFYSTVDCHV